MESPMGYNNSPKAVSFFPILHSSKKPPTKIHQVTWAKGFFLFKVKSAKNMEEGILRDLGSPVIHVKMGEIHLGKKNFFLDLRVIIRCWRKKWTKTYILQSGGESHGIPIHKKYQKITCKYSKCKYLVEHVLQVSGAQKNTYIYMHIYVYTRMWICVNLAVYRLFRQVADIYSDVEFLQGGPHTIIINGVISYKPYLWTKIHG